MSFAVCKIEDRELKVYCELVVRLCSMNENTLLPMGCDGVLMYTEVTYLLLKTA